MSKKPTKPTKPTKKPSQRTSERGLSPERVAFYENLLETSRQNNAIWRDNAAEQRHIQQVYSAGRCFALMINAACPVVPFDRKSKESERVSSYVKRQTKWRGEDIVRCAIPTFAFTRGVNISMHTPIINGVPMVGTAQVFTPKNEPRIDSIHKLQSYLYVTDLTQNAAIPLIDNGHGYFDRDNEIEGTYGCTQMTGYKRVHMLPGTKPQGSGFGYVAYCAQATYIHMLRLYDDDETCCPSGSDQRSAFSLDNDSYYDMFLLENDDVAKDGTSSHEGSRSEDAERMWVKLWENGFTCRKWFSHDVIETTEVRREAETKEVRRNFETNDFDDEDCMARFFDELIPAYTNYIRLVSPFWGFTFPWSRMHDIPTLMPTDLGISQSTHVGTYRYTKTTQEEEEYEHRETIKTTILADILRFDGEYAREYNIKELPVCPTRLSWANRGDKEFREFMEASTAPFSEKDKPYALVSKDQYYPPTEIGQAGASQLVVALIENYDPHLGFTQEALLKSKYTLINPDLLLICKLDGLDPRFIPIFVAILRQAMEEGFGITEEDIKNFEDGCMGIKKNPPPKLPKHLRHTAAKLARWSSTLTE